MTLGTDLIEPETLPKSIQKQKMGTCNRVISLLPKGPPFIMRLQGLPFGKTHHMLGGAFPVLLPQHSFLLLLLCTALLVRALGASGTVRALNYALSILGLGTAAGVALRGRYPVLILLGGTSFARIRIDGSGSLTIAANGLTSCVFDAIRKRNRSKKHTRNHQ
ncbi:MAG: hypothetical protein WA628_05810 [Terriglobales bacterium]